MISGNKIRIAVIPAYEPDDNLPGLVRDVHDAGIMPIVIDDGSGPAFTDIFERTGAFAVVLTQAENSGKGRAIKTGLEYIKENYHGCYSVVTMDSDGQHSLPDALRVCEAAEQHPEELILGSRKLKDNVPLRSRFGNSITRFVYRMCTGSRVHDTQTGLRAFSETQLPALLKIPGERYEYEMNVLMDYARRKIPIREIEIATIYINNNAASHFDPVKDSVRIYKEIFRQSFTSFKRTINEFLKYSASSFVSFLIDYGLYSLLTVLTAGLGTASLTVSNITARVVSASVNYTLNRKFVFKSKTNILKSAVQYFLLATAILAGNTIVLNLLVGQLGLNAYWAKLFTELGFFILSWLVQRLLIFRKKEVTQ